MYTLPLNVDQCMVQHEYLQLSMYWYLHEMLHSDLCEWLTASMAVDSVVVVMLEWYELSGRIVLFVLLFWVFVCSRSAVGVFCNY